jgi:hypothetical protein
MKKPLLAMGSLAFLLLSCPALTHCDTLYKDKTALAIGLGTDFNGIIHWSDCSGANKKEYKKPPHWVDKADNCKLNPSDFGLEFQKGKFVVVDKAKFEKFFPGAKVGEEVDFVKTDSGIEFRYRSKTLKLWR